MLDLIEQVSDEVGKAQFVAHSLDFGTGKISGFEDFCGVGASMEAS